MFNQKSSKYIVSAKGQKFYTKHNTVGKSVADWWHSAPNTPPVQRSHSAMQQCHCTQTLTNIPDCANLCACWTLEISFLIISKSVSQDMSRYVKIFGILSLWLDDFQMLPVCLGLSRNVLYHLERLLIKNSPKLSASWSYQLLLIWVDAIYTILTIYITSSLSFALIDVTDVMSS